MARKTIALALLVHNEAHLLPYLFEQIGDRIDSAAIIVHPDYEDNSAEVARDLCEKYCLRYIVEERDLPDPPTGENLRNEVFDLAREFNEDYVIWLDPDDPLIGTIPDELEHPLYVLEHQSVGTSWCVEHLAARDHPEIRWHGLIHETLSGGGIKGELLEDCYIERANGSGGGTERQTNVDLPLLLSMVEKNPGDGNAWYYLAQTYRDLGMLPEAVAAFNHRAEMGGVLSLVYWCRFQVAEITLDPNDYLIAYNTHPKRSEALHRLAATYNARGQYYVARLFALIGLNTPPTEDAGFVERWVEEYGLVAECAVAKYYMGEKEDALQAFEYVLSLDTLKPEHRAIFELNLKEIKKEERRQKRAQHNGRVTPKKQKQLAVA